MHRLRAACLLHAALLTPAVVGGQTVRGEVVDAETLRPLAASVVALIDESGSTVLSMLTGEEGRFRGTAPQPGTYTLRVHRIGYESVVAGPIVLRAGSDVFERIEVAVVPITLAGIEVSAGRRCVVRPGPEASETARVWEQARTALSSAAETVRQRMLRFDTEMYVRELDARSLGVTAEQRSFRRGSFLPPFGARDPEDLFENGFVQPVDGGRSYNFYAPTAEVLLSDAFLDTHCLRLEAGRGEEEGLIGLAFEPVRRRAVSDIEGTLWLDPATASLRHVEMRYVASDPSVPVDGALARVEFEPLPDGRWIVGSWFIRMPRITEERLGGLADYRVARSITSFRQEGGEVRRITTSDGRIVSSAARVAVGGIVYDSLAGGPLRRARVSLAGTDYQTESGADGRFGFDEIPPGRYTIRVEHQRLDSLPAAATPSTEIEVVEGQPFDVRVAVPALQTIVEAACPGLWRAQRGARLPGYPFPVYGRTVLTGIVRDPGGQAVPGAIAHVGWDTFSVTNAIINVREVIPEVTADGDGRFLLCGVPDDMALSVWATSEDVTGTPIVVPPGGWFVFAEPVLGVRRQN